MYADQHGASACAEEPFTKAAFGTESQGGQVDHGGTFAPRGGTLFARGGACLVDQFARQVTRAAGKAILSIDHTLELVAESERRIQQLAKAAAQKG